MQTSLAEEYDLLRADLLGLHGVSSGVKFGGEAFFYGKRFFCHIHRGKDFLLLETFVWNKVDNVVESVPGVRPHPQYGGYGWVRFRISSPDDLDKARLLIEMSHDYMTRMRRVSLPKTRKTRTILKSAEVRFPTIRFEAKDSLKRTQVIIEAQRITGSIRPSELLNQAVLLLRQS